MNTAGQRLYLHSTPPPGLRDPCLPPRTDRLHAKDAHVTYRLQVQQQFSGAEGAAEAANTSLVVARSGPPPAKTHIN